MELSIKEDREELKISIMDGEDGSCFAFMLCENEEHYDDELNNAKQAIEKIEAIAPLETQKEELEEQIEELESDRDFFLVSWS